MRTPLALEMGERFLVQGKKNLNPLQEACVRQFQRKRNLAEIIKTAILVAAVNGNRDGMTSLMERLTECYFPGEAQSSKEAEVASAKRVFQQFDGMAIRIGSGQKADWLTKEEASDAIKAQNELLERRKQEKLEKIKRQISEDSRRCLRKSSGTR